ncbi:hypothetical protein MLIT_45320 [Mycolicibacterium litorale]|uniref:Uncharacterized protein n=1 Tax=Mycolicibacterium litorale TaxID=758802 RepID=A0AAD1IND8_9MYCO|nr:hypothetical protein MLIT_45320 [Mycolicibacterium litorale]
MTPGSAGLRSGHVAAGAQAANARIRDVPAADLRVGADNDCWEAPERVLSTGYATETLLFASGEACLRSKPANPQFRAFPSPDGSTDTNIWAVCTWMMA